MLQQIDACFTSTAVYPHPHAFLSGHAHNYQRYTRMEGGGQTSYVVAGMGGHNSNPPFGKMTSPPRPPFTIGQFRCDNYSANYGYPRAIVTQQQLRIEYQDATTAFEIAVGCGEGGPGYALVGGILSLRRKAKN